MSNSIIIDAKQRENDLQAKLEGNVNHIFKINESRYNVVACNTTMAMIKLIKKVKIAPGDVITFEGVKRSV